MALAPHPSPLPREREPVTNASAVIVLERGLWPPWHVSEKPLSVRPLLGRGGGEGAHHLVIAVSIHQTPSRPARSLEMIPPESRERGRVTRVALTLLIVSLVAGGLGWGVWTPSGPSVHEVIALAEAGRFDEAEAKARACLSTFHSNDAVHLLLAQIVLKRAGIPSSKDQVLSSKSALAALDHLSRVRPDNPRMGDRVSCQPGQRPGTPPTPGRGRGGLARGDPNLAGRIRGRLEPVQSVLPSGQRGGCQTPRGAALAAPD